MAVTIISTTISTKVSTVPFLDTRASACSMSAHIIERLVLALAPHLSPDYSAAHSASELSGLPSFGQGKPFAATLKLLAAAVFR